MKVLNVKVSFDYQCPLCSHEERISVEPSRLRPYSISSGWSDVDDGHCLVIDYFPCPNCKTTENIQVYKENP